MADLPEPAFDPDEVRRVVEDVLSRPEYADLRPGFLERVLGAVLEQVDRAFAALDGTGFGTAAGGAVLLLALGLAGWLVARFVRGVRRDPAAEVAVAGEVGRSREDWLAEAGRHEQAGRLRDAVRCRYRALVAWLAERGVVEEVPGRTTGEYLEEVRRAAPRAAAPYAEVTTAFEAAWYGHARVTVADIDRLRAAEEAVTEAAGARAGLPEPVGAAAGGPGGDSQGTSRGGSRGDSQGTSRGGSSGTSRGGSPGTSGGDAR